MVLATPRFTATYSYNIPMPTLSSIVDMTAASSAKPLLVNKLLVQSPPLDNIYKDYVVTSKPLNLRRYKNGSKTKKTKKDSKIYYIPVPPLPYRYIPGIGYDYQPMKIKPIMQETMPTATTPATTTAPIPAKLNPALASHGGQHQNSLESQVFRVQHHSNNYYFNGRPFRLQVAHAGRRHALTPLNLKSKLYYNKNIIY
ncbi:uncharacterized protein LOC115621667 [Scaptodrosophila lebanonensis]|uniref:Uncharacterized protein LOC115621667 n=1 Tax=Drosophila lebanonensis TaxID=7225 RepID=A0A6J2T2U2_DROLE|nr:uncharacterized protein LOC115621667 [Scaptodrosophila lebanonensis]